MDFQFSRQSSRFGESSRAAQANGTSGVSVIPGRAPEQRPQGTIIPSAQFSGQNVQIVRPSMLQSNQFTSLDQFPSLSTGQGVQGTNGADWRVSCVLCYQFHHRTVFNPKIDNERNAQISVCCCNCIEAPFLLQTSVQAARQPSNVPVSTQLGSAAFFPSLGSSSGGETSSVWSKKKIADVVSASLFEITASAETTGETRESASKAAGPRSLASPAHPAA